jgi:hypothetical protein
MPLYDLLERWGGVSECTRVGFDSATRSRDLTCSLLFQNGDKSPWPARNKPTVRLVMIQGASNKTAR